MKYNVWNYNMNKNKIERFNIFDHSSFYKQCIKNYKQFQKDKDWENFEKEIHHNIFYYYWCKSEYEVLIRAWCGGNGKEEVKVDVYNQITMNWDMFIVALIDEMENNCYKYNEEGELIDEEENA